MREGESARTQRSLTLILGALLGASTFGGASMLFLYNYGLLSRTANQGFLRHEQLVMGQIGNRVTVPLATYDIASVQKVLEASLAEGSKDRKALGVLDAVGQIQASVPGKDYLEAKLKEAQDAKALGSLHRYSDGEWLILQVPIESKRWDTKGAEQVMALGQLVGVFSPRDVKSELRGTVLQSLLIMLIVSLLAVGAAYRVMDLLILRPIQDLVLASGTIAEGRLDVAVEARGSGSTRELASLAEAIRRMTGTMAAFVRTIQPTAEKVGASSVRLKEITQQSSTNITQAVQVMTQISQSMAQVAQGTQSMASSVGQAGTSAQEGGKLAVQVVQKMKQAQESVAAAAGFIHGLGRQSNEIGNIVDLITKIADQTNLLSLNAAIEAARAGESGRGFAVVADEIRKLAESSAESTQKITKLIRQVQDETAHAIKATEKGNQDVAEGYRLTLEAEQLFQAIAKEVLQVNSQVSHMAANTEEVAASTEEATATSEELSAAIEQVATNAGDLGEIVESLRALVGKFKAG